MATALLLLSTASAFAVDFCWKGSYGRGVGTIPTECPGRDKIGLLCYSKCPATMARFGFDCHSVCPSGMRDDGLFCALTQTTYGRGAGYAAWDWNKCVSENSQGCEWWGALIYPKCKTNFHNDACCICSANAPDCNALGLNGNVAWSCAKKVYIGDPIPMSCANGKENNGGLCYQPCVSGFTGVGPVCWGRVPDGMVNCGMGAAKDDWTCGNIVFDQVSSVGMLAANIATLGLSTPATKTLSQAKEVYQQVKDQYNAAKFQIENGVAIPTAKVQAINAMGAVIAATDAASAASQATSDAEKAAYIMQSIAQIASIADPTGAADVVASYSYPVCSAIAEADWRFCASENSFCGFDGTAVVRYGVAG